MNNEADLCPQSGNGKDCNGSSGHGETLQLLNESHPCPPGNKGRLCGVSGCAGTAVRLMCASRPTGSLHCDAMTDQQPIALLTVVQ